MVVTEEDNSPEDSVIQILNQDLIIIHNQAITITTTEDSDPMMVAVSDQAEVLPVVVLEAAVLQVVEAVASDHLAEAEAAASEVEDNFKLNNY